MCQLDWAIGHLHVWCSISLGVPGRLFLDEINIPSANSEADCFADAYHRITRAGPLSSQGIGLFWASDLKWSLSTSEKWGLAVFKPLASLISLLIADLETSQLPISLWSYPSTYPGFCLFCFFVATLTNTDFAINSCPRRTKHAGCFPRLLRNFLNWLLSCINPNIIMSPS